MVNLDLLNVGVVLLVIFGLVGAVDLFYFHLIRFKLYSHKETRREHILHTLRNLLFIPMAYILFAGNFGGLMLWAFLVIFLVDLCIEMIDVMHEKKSRAKLGGLPSGEYAIHMLGTTLRVAAFAFALAAKPISLWSSSSPIILPEEYPVLVETVAWLFVVSSTIGFVQHIWLYIRHKPTEL